MSYERPSILTRADGICSGERREALNIAAESSGSIHDDEKAAELGYKGGLVSGLVHNEQFVPIALDLFGPVWLERGGFSLAYRTPTLDGEPVKAFARVPAEGARRGHRTTRASASPTACCSLVRPRHHSPNASPRRSLRRGASCVTSPSGRLGRSVGSAPPSRCRR